MEKLICELGKKDPDAPNKQAKPFPALTKWSTNASAFFHLPGAGDSSRTATTDRPEHFHDSTLGYDIPLDDGSDKHPSTPHAR